MDIVPNNFIEQTGSSDSPCTCRINKKCLQFAIYKTSLHLQIVEGSKNRACSREIPPSFKLHFCANTGIVLSLSEYFGDFPLDKKEHNSFS